MLNTSCLIVLFTLMWSASPADQTSAADDKSAPIVVKLQVDKPELAVPVKLAFPPIAFHFCVNPGLETTEFITRPTTGCPSGTVAVDGANVDQITGAFAKDTEYTVTAPDKSRILVFCNAKACTPEQNATMKEAILQFAKPSPLRLAFVDPPSGVTAKQLAAGVGKMLSGKITGRVLPNGKVRLETDANLDKPDVDDLNSQIRNATPATLAALSPLPDPVGGIRIPLPSFCIAEELSGPEPSPPDPKTGCPAGTRLAPSSNAANSAAAVTTDKTKVTADTVNSVVVSCGGSKCDSDTLDLIASSLTAIARPSPSRIKDIPVLSGTAAGSAAKIAIWSKGLITADVLSDTAIRLKSDVYIPETDVEIWRQRLLDDGFGAPFTPPVKPLFYRNTVDVVSSLAGAPPVAAPLVSGTSAPNTSGTSAAPASAPAAAAPATAPAPASPAVPSPGLSAFGMTPLDDYIVLTANPPDTDAQRSRLMALIDLPRPEVLMNMWTLQASSPDGADIAGQSQIIRSAVALHNDALQNAIQYGWNYLSRQMNDGKYFDLGFYSYLTQRFVADTPACLKNPKDSTCIAEADRKKWKLCEAGEYCLGYADAFNPLKPTLTNILLGLMAAADPFQAVFTTLGCMEGKYQIDGLGADCFPAREKLQPNLSPRMTLTETQACMVSHSTTALLQAQGAGRSATEKVAKAVEARSNDARLLEGEYAKLPEASCEDLDRAALEIQKSCGVTLSLPLSCFTEQAAKSFVPYHDFSTFTSQQLSILGQLSIASLKSKWGLQENEKTFSTTPIGLLRAATATFLFNYKMAQEFPRDFSPYLLSHSAQDLNAEFNPLVVAFNQDVAAFSRVLMDQVQEQLQGKRWKGRNKSFVADGLVTVRGLSGLESLVDTDTQSAFSAPQYQTPASVLSNLAGIAGGGSAPPSGTTTTNSTSTVSGDTTTSTSTTAPAPQPAPPPVGSNLTSVLPSFLSRASFPAALAAAVLPTGAQVQIGRQLTLDITPHSLPGASSAELDVKLWAQEDSPPALYKDGGTSPQTDPLSRIARHNVFTRVRVESVKLFEISSFSALVQRPRTKFPLVPPFIEIPLIGDILGLPLPGAKVYYRSTAIVSAIVVPTAADLAFGIEFVSDRAAVADKTFRRVGSINQLPWRQGKLYEYNRAKTECFASSSPCAIQFDNLAPDR